MDKRYFLIIIIICVCCLNLYMISNVSEIVGSASVDDGKYTFSLPGGFSLYDTSASYVMIFNPNNQMKIYVFTVLKNEDNFSNAYQWTKENSKILSTGTINYKGIKIQSIYYQNFNDPTNKSVFYFNKYNNNFKITIVNFNHVSQKNETIDIVVKIVDSMRTNNKVLN